MLNLPESAYMQYVYRDVGMCNLWRSVLLDRMSPMNNQPPWGWSHQHVTHKPKISQVATNSTTWKAKPKSTDVLHIDGAAAPDHALM